MTKKEFEEQKFSPGEYVTYKNIKYEIRSVDFEENIIGIGDENIFWVRFENCDFTI